MIRLARPDDVSAILQMIKDLADYERSLDEVQTTEEDLQEALFAERPSVSIHVVEEQGELIGYAMWFVSFSAWVGRPGIWLVDLYVRPDQRGHGFGKQLLQTLASICVERRYGRLEWKALDWNQPAIDFYMGLGAKPLADWTTYQLVGDALHSVANS